MHSPCHVSLDATQVKRFVRGRTEERNVVIWSVVRLEVFYGCVDYNWVFCVLALSGMGRVIKVL
jgi:hypothetical protein